MEFFILDDICPKENFICKNGKCLEASKICDSHNDCGDNSDETTICSGLISIVMQKWKSFQFKNIFQCSSPNFVSNIFILPGAICSFHPGLCELSKNRTHIAIGDLFDGVMNKGILNYKEYFEYLRLTTNIELDE